MTVSAVWFKQGPLLTLTLDVLIHSSLNREIGDMFSVPLPQNLEWRFSNFLTQNGDGISSFLGVSYPPDQPSSSPACSWVCPGSLPFPPPLSAERSSLQFCHPAAFFPVEYNQHGLDQIIEATIKYNNWTSKSKMPLQTQVLTPWQPKSTMTVLFGHYNQKSKYIMCKTSHMSTTINQNFDLKKKNKNR